MRAELVLKRARYKHSRYTQGEEARGRKNVGWFRAELHHFSLPLPPPSIHHFRSPRSRVPLPYSRARRQFPATMFRFYLSLLSPSNDGLHSRPRRCIVYYPRALSFSLIRSVCSSTTVLFFRVVRSSFLSTLDRNSPLPPSGMICPLERGEEKIAISIHFCTFFIDDQMSSTNEQINLLKLCFTLFFLVLIRR